ncbi:MAG: DUF4386 domain-containing protein [Candidatus Promineifilaceae bacterium]
MNTNKKTARIVGVLFLTAMVTSILGGAIIESILTAPDYLIDVSANETQVVIGVLLELINATAVVGIAVMMFPLFKKHNEALALGYVGFRIIEAVIAIGAVITPLTLIALSQEYLTAGASDASYFQTLGTSFIEVRAQLVGQMLGIFFSIGALLFYYLLYQSKFVPRFISVWGLIGAVLVLTWNLLEILGISLSVGMILALPIILNEIFLGIWLIAKGFNPSSIVSDSAKADIDEV